MGTNDQLRELLRQKREIEDKIRGLNGGVPIIAGNAKIDIIRTNGPQYGCYAVSYKYRYTSWHGYDRTWINTEKWVPLFQRKTREEAISAIPDAISQLQSLYDMLTAGGENNVKAAGD